MEKFGQLRKILILIIYSVSGCSFYLDVNRLFPFLQGSFPDTATPTDLKRRDRLLILIVDPSQPSFTKHQSSDSLQLSWQNSIVFGAASVAGGYSTAILISAFTCRESITLAGQHPILASSYFVLAKN